MPQLKGTKTHGNLKAAFAGESQANRRYLYFAKVADVEGYPEFCRIMEMNRGCLILIAHLGNFEIMGRRKGYYRDNGEDAYMMGVTSLDDAYRAKLKGFSRDIVRTLRITDHL